jgi:hypothetical protein
MMMMVVGRRTTVLVRLMLAFLTEGYAPRTLGHQTLPLYNQVFTDGEACGDLHLVTDLQSHLNQVLFARPSEPTVNT